MMVVVVLVYEATGTYRFRRWLRDARHNFNRLFMDYHRRRLNLEGGPPILLTIFLSERERRK